MTNRCKRLQSKIKGHLGGARSERRDDVTAEVSDDAEARVANQALRQLALLHHGLPQPHIFLKLLVSLDGQMISRLVMLLHL
jgi:hypothetical protein